MTAMEWAERMNLGAVTHPWMASSGEVVIPASNRHDAETFAAFADCDLDRRHYYAFAEDRPGWGWVAVIRERTNPAPIKVSQESVVGSLDSLDIQLACWIGESQLGVDE